MTELDEMVADLQEKINRAALLRQHAAKPPMNAVAFRPYYHAGINFQINTLHEEQLLNQILNMDFETVSATMDEVNLANTLDYPCIREHWHSVKIRAIALRVHQLQVLGECQPKSTIGSFLQGWFRGSIIANEHQKRFGW